MTGNFIINALLLGVGLAMDDFSVSVANGLEDPKMKKGRMIFIALTFGVFQTVMPLLGWFFIHKLAQAFALFEKFVPYIALTLLLYIGSKMIYETLAGKNSEETLGVGGILVQGIATSIDALSVGLTIAVYSFEYALSEALIIGIVTTLICIGGVVIGKAGGSRLSDKAGIIGGIVLILVGIRIFIAGVLS